MQYEVIAQKEFDFGATGVKEILQNVAFILSTMKYSCPMDRGFGWEPELDGPIHIQRATNMARIIEAIQVQEPRAIVDEVMATGNALDGHTKLLVRVMIDE